MTDRILGLVLILAGLAFDIGVAVYIGRRWGRSESRPVVSDPSRTPTVELPAVPTGGPFAKRHELVMVLTPVQTHRAHYRTGRARPQQAPAELTQTRQFELPRGTL